MISFKANQDNVVCLDDLFEMTDYYGIKDDDFVVVGGAVMSYYGLRPNADIDIVLSDRIHKRVLEDMDANDERLKKKIHPFYSHRKVHVLADGSMTALAKIPIDERIDNPAYHTVSKCGVRFVSPELAYIAKVKAALHFDNSRMLYPKDYYDVCCWSAFLEASGWDKWLLSDELMDTVEWRKFDGYLVKMPEPQMARSVVYSDGKMRIEEGWEPNRATHFGLITQGKVRPL